jgi:hypothetical protein
MLTTNGKSLSMIHQQSRPFPMLTTMGNRCPSEISIHFPNRKESSQLGYFSISKINVFNNIFSAPSQPGESFLPFQLRELFPRSPSSLENMKTLFWIEVLSGCLLYAHLWGYTQDLPLLIGLYLE